MAVKPLVVEYTFTIVSLVHGRERFASMAPPQRSPPGRPSIVIATAAPTSPRCSKFSAKASRTRRNPESQVPSIFPTVIPSSIAVSDWLVPLALPCCRGQNLRCGPADVLEVRDQGLSEHLGRYQDSRLLILPPVAH